MITTKQQVLMVALAASLAGPALADSFKPRWYFGAGAGQSRLTPDTSEDQNTELFEERDTGAALYLGYDVSEYFSIEAHYADLGAAELTDSAQLAATGEIDYAVGGISGVAYLFNSQGPAGRQRREGLSLFGRIGIGAMDNEGTVPFRRENDMHLGLGLGLEAYIGYGFSARLAYDAYDEDARFTSLGIVKRLGEPGRARVAKVQPEPEKAPEPPKFVDSDGDGVADSLDACPGTRVGESVDVRGCVFAGVLEGVNFETNSARLTREAKVVLDGVIQEMLRYPDVRVEVGAHTDNRGSDQFNQALSDRRAKSVVEYLVKNGVSSERLQARGYGESEPAYRNDTQQGRQKNRRVVFRVVDR